MVVHINKNFTQIRPLYLPDNQFVVIAFSNIIEVHDSNHVLIWKIEEKFKVIKLEYLDNDKLKFYVGLENGMIKLCDIKNTIITEMMHVKNGLKNVFIHNEEVIIVENNRINFYSNFDVNSKQELSKEALQHISFSKKTGIVAMAEKHRLTVFNVKNSENKINHYLARHKKSSCFTTVCCHPTDLTIATADSSGKIQVWWDVLNSTNKFSVFHWHFLSLNALEFVCDGQHLLSGGREQVLVKWDITITNSENNKKFLPRLESDIHSIQAFMSEDGEYYLVTLDDNSYRIINSALVTTNTYANLVQRPAILHDKIHKKCHLNPIGLTSCHNLPEKLRSTVILNGKEGKIQFFDMKSRSTKYQLDVVYKNWATETENHLIPGFLQVQAMAVPQSGRYIAAYEAVGVPTNDIDYQRTLKMFRWNEIDEIYENEYELSFDWMERVCQMVFHPVNDNYLFVIAEDNHVAILERRVERGALCWDTIQIFDMDEVLHRLKIKIDVRHKNSPVKLTSIETGGKNNDALLLITKGDCIVIFEWRFLLKFSTIPNVAVNLNALIDDLDIDEDQRQKLCDCITSSTIFRHDQQFGLYRIVIGLQHGLIIVEARVKSNWSIDLTLVSSALTANPVRCLVSCPATPHQSEARVAVLFDSNIKIFSVWSDNVGSTSRILSVPKLDCVTWFQTPERWVLVGLNTDGHLRSIVLCDESDEHLFTEERASLVKRGVDLLAMGDDVEEIENTQPPANKRLCLNRAWQLYDSRTAPPMEWVLQSIFMIE